MKIPDHTLVLAIREELDYPVGEITRSILDRLTSLIFHGSGEGISDLTGLEYAVNLLSLEAPGNSFTDLSPLGGLPCLESLLIHYNNLVNIDPLLHIPCLERVEVNHNHLDLSPGSDARHVIETLEKQGVKVYHDAYPPEPGEEPIMIPDPNFESALREALNYPLGHITKSVMSHLAFLYPDNQDITDLTGLEHATNLEELYLYGNEVNDISILLLLPELKFVNLQANPLDLQMNSPARLVIEELESRGVWVVHDPFPESRLVTFTVTDTNKNPINGAWVSAQGEDCCKEGYTNIFGHAELYLPLGNYSFIIWADGYIDHSGTITIPGDSEVVVSLEFPGETFLTKFTVTDPDLVPVANAFIYVASDYFWARGSCDSEGNLVLNLPEGEYSLYIEANGFATKHSHQVEFCVPRDAKVVTVLLPLDDLFSVGFTVFDPEGEPVENAYVEVDCGDFYFYGYTDWDGGLTLNLPEGNYEVLVLAEGYATYTGEFAVPVEMQVTIKLSWE